MLTAAVQSAARLGTHGPVLIACSMLLGALAPTAAAPAQAALPLAVFLMSFGSLTAAGLAPRETSEPPVRLALIIAAVTAGPCAAAALAVEALGVAPELALGIVISVAGPPVASAAALAVIVGLPPRLTLVLSIAPMLLCPVAVPLLVRVFVGTTIDPVALAVQLLAVIGGAALAAVAALRLCRRHAAVQPPTLAASGVAVVGLMMVGVATAARARLEVQADPAAFGGLILGAVALTATLALAGALIVAPLGRTRAATVGLVWGFRNQTLVWAVIGSTLPPAAERFLVAMVLPILITPLLLRAVRTLRRRHIAQPAADAAAAETFAR